ncbi:MAG TPA: TIGR00730 family Rossman fold protein [Candidatus Dormibacteraeota bacterium]|nr:TIGR00730 family Rossman fold protein [Candidatus Dormibacteraeota bacterium]
MSRRPRSKQRSVEIDPPYRDAVFMESLPARPVRILTEYIDPLERLRREKVGDTIVMFGSARILSREQALARLEKVRKGAKRRSTPERRTALRDAKASLEMSRYYEEARELARRITSWAMSLGDNPRRFVICSGGGPGIMEAANLGAAEAGGKSIGLSIQLPHEQRPNDYISPELSFMFHYFFMRKLWFSQLAKALIVFPGGYGTMDELWEMLTLMQTGKLQRRNLILIYGRKYWDRVLDWKHMLRCGTIDKHEYGLLEFADTVDQAFERVRNGLEMHLMKPDALLQ